MFSHTCVGFLQAFWSPLTRCGVPSAWCACPKVWISVWIVIHLCWPLDRCVTIAWCTLPLAQSQLELAPASQQPCVKSAITNELMFQWESVQKLPLPFESCTKYAKTLVHKELQFSMFYSTGDTVSVFQPLALLPEWDNWQTEITLLLLIRRLFRRRTKIYQALRTNGATRAVMQNISSCGLWKSKKNIICKSVFSFYVKSSSHATSELVYEYLKGQQRAEEQD